MVPEKRREKVQAGRLRLRVQSLRVDQVTNFSTRCSHAAQGGLTSIGRAMRRRKLALPPVVRTKRISQKERPVGPKRVR